MRYLNRGSGAFATIFIFALLSSSQAQAMFEVRAGYGLNFGAPPHLNTYHGYIMAPKVPSVGGFVIDALASLPTVPFGFGLRYENMRYGANTSTSLYGDYTYDTGFTRIALLINYRILDSVVYAGPIGSIGISNSAFYKAIYNGRTTEYETTSGTTLSLGAEGGVKFGNFIVGGEAGYFIGDFGTPLNYATPLVDTTGEKIPLEFNGLYARILVGTSF